MCVYCIRVYHILRSYVFPPGDCFLVLNIFFFERSISASDIHDLSSSVTVYHAKVGLPGAFSANVGLLSIFDMVKLSVRNM